MYILEFEINALPKTTNKALRMHWAARHTENKKWDRWVNVMVLSMGKPEKPLKKAKLTLTRCSSARPDPDGLANSFKCVVDSLVTCGVLENDTYENIGMPEYAWKKANKGKGKIVVRVEENEI